MFNAPEREVLPFSECQTDTFTHFELANNADVEFAQATWGGSCLQDVGENLNIEGHDSSSTQTTIEVSLYACEEDQLPVGQTCMTDEELSSYYDKM